MTTWWSEGRAPWWLRIWHRLEMAWMAATTPGQVLVISSRPDTVDPKKMRIEFLCNLVTEEMCDSMNSMEMKLRTTLASYRERLEAKGEP